MRAIYGVDPYSLNSRQYHELAWQLYETAGWIMSRSTPTGSEAIALPSSRYQGAVYEWLVWYQDNVVQWHKNRWGNSPASDDNYEENDFVGVEEL